jgi:hypothetical protein
VPVRDGDALGVHRADEGVMAPLASSVLGTTAMTITTSAMAPLEAHTFVPVTT